MKWNNKKNIFIQATVALILLFSAGVSAVHPTTPSRSTTSTSVESTFYEGDTPVITVTVTPPTLVFGQCYPCWTKLCYSRTVRTKVYTTIVGASTASDILSIYRDPTRCKP